MNRLRLAVAAVFATYLAVCLSGCATVRHDPLYDGGPIVPSVAGDSATYVRITIQNTRVHDAGDPHFYLIGTGRHSLGVLGGPSGKRVLFVDSKWFGPDGCMTIVAHYTGWADYTFQQFCWTPGYVIDVALNEIFSTSNAWAHR